MGGFHFDMTVRLGDVVAAMAVLAGIYRGWFKLNAKIDLAQQRTEMQISATVSALKVQTERLAEHETLDRQQFDKITDRLADLANSLARVVGRMENYAQLRGQKAG